MWRREGKNNKTVASMAKPKLFVGVLQFLLL